LFNSALDPNTQAILQVQARLSISSHSGTVDKRRAYLSPNLWICMGWRVGRSQLELQNSTPNWPNGNFPLKKLKNSSSQTFQDGYIS
jgi:hypothetical protein